jgi:hypothetical protein
MNKRELLAVLGLPDAFENFTPVEGTKLWGWNGDRPIFPALVQDIKPKLVIEVGSWMGLSAANLAQSCQHLGLDTAVICIDTWLGSKEHWRDPDLLKHLELKNGYPDFYKRFLTNMVNSEVGDRVVPLPMPSQIGASYLKDFPEVRAELIYIDGSHDEKDVYDDLSAYWDILAPGGVVFGDDWPWDSVANAVKGFCAGVGVPYQVNDINWIIRKPF